jgi:glycerophosphoryl diester phosphodiesterase
MLENSDWKTERPLIIAHRGASGHAPENTMAAFRLAAEQGADAIELDAKLSADGVIVIHHDTTLDRTTSGKGPLYKHLWRDLQSLDAGAKFGDHFAGERIPTLRQVLEELGSKLLINVELTNYVRPWDRLPEYAVDLVKELALEKRVLFSSFNPVALSSIKRIAPDIPTGLLLLPQEPAWIRKLLREKISHQALHLHKKLVSTQIVAREHAKGRPVNVWTVNEIRHMREMINIGVDGLITDFPDTALEVIQESQG